MTYKIYTNWTSLYLVKNNIAYYEKEDRLDKLTLLGPLDRGVLEKNLIYFYGSKSTGIKVEEVIDPLLIKEYCPQTLKMYYRLENIDDILDDL